MDRDRLLNRLNYLATTSLQTVTEKTVMFKTGQRIACDWLKSVIEKTGKEADEIKLNSFLKGFCSVVEDIKRFIE